jgi:hypothetical protein
VKKPISPNASSAAHREAPPWQHLHAYADGTTRHCHPPLPALIQVLDTISKRDPAATFNRYIHIDATPLTWSYAVARELCRALERSGS